MNIFIKTVLMFAVFAAVGCGGGNTNTPDTKEKPKEKASVKVKGIIGVSVLTLTNPFFKVIGDTIKEQAEKAGYSVEVVSGEFDVAKQQSQVKDFLVKKVVAIVLCPCDSRSIGAVIQEANKAGVPVFTADIACLAPDAQVVTHIATDNYEGGKQAGIATIEAMGEAGGKVAVLDFRQAESCILRVKGFKEVIDAHNKKNPKAQITIVAELPGDGKKDKSQSATEDVLQTHPDLAAIFAINDPSALGARAALERANKADAVKIIGFDGQPDGKQAIKEGKIFADPVQFPDKIGQQTVAAMLDYFDGKTPPKNILIPTGLYKKADAMKDPELK
ncbi:MAG: substrate-binding domain-containing protein [Gemmataceae bacterium]|nr:substrate-binding domain-containing protein [Gemmataceae bacterium]